MLLNKRLFSLIIFVFFSFFAIAQSNSVPCIGPEKGSLVIVGGNMKDTNIVLKFIELAGGKDAQIVVIPNASGLKNPDPDKFTRFLTRMGAQNVSMLFTLDPKTANTEKFVKPLKTAKGIWFSGGRQWRIVDAYANTLTEKSIRGVLDRGGVIGGSSAGATIQGSFLVRGDTKTNRIMMGDHQKGFAYLKNSAIDQHLLVRNRQFDLIEILKAHPNLLGIGLDENTAIIVTCNQFEVMGQSFVAIYDTRLWSDINRTDQKPALPNGAKFFLLRAGDKYDLQNREVVHWNGTNRGISRDKDVK